jgi:hypothetical protein
MVDSAHLYIPCLTSLAWISGGGPGAVTCMAKRASSMANVEDKMANPVSLRHTHAHSHKPADPDLGQMC